MLPGYECALPAGGKPFALVPGSECALCPTMTPGFGGAPYFLHKRRKGCGHLAPAPTPTWQGLSLNPLNHLFEHLYTFHLEMGPQAAPTGEARRAEEGESGWGKVAVEHLLALALSNISSSYLHLFICLFFCYLFNTFLLTFREKRRERAREKHE